MKDFEDELLAHPRGKHDDLIDSASMALEHLTPSSLSIASKESPQEVVNESTGQYGYSMSWWLKQQETPTLSVYDRFMADLKVKP